jgi:hypothetical protein
MTKIFLDVGGYEGESTWAALDPIFGFDRVFCFEPVSVTAHAQPAVSGLHFIFTTEIEG